MKKAKNILGKVLVFEAGSKVWAAELSRIKEVVRSQYIMPLPNSTPMVAGVISVRGEIIPILAGSWCGEPRESQAGKTSGNILLLQSMQDFIGVAVERVRGIEDIHAYDIGSISMTKDYIKELVSCSIMVSSSGTVPLLDARLLVEYVKSAAPSMQRGNSTKTDDKATSSTENIFRHF